MTMDVLLTLAFVHLLGSQTAVAKSRPAAIAVAMGVATAALIWAATAQAGLALSLSRIDGLDLLLRAAGATILIVLGARLIAAPEGATPALPEHHGKLGNYVVRGVLVNLSNPKSLVYFTSVFTVLVPTGASPAIRLAAVVIVFGESMSWHSLLALSSPESGRAASTLASAHGLIEPSAASSFCSARVSSRLRPADV